MLISRSIASQVREGLEPGKIVVIYGPRQVGKTTLVKQLLSDFTQKESLSINADQLKYRQLLESQDLQTLAGLMKGYRIVVIDEAQRVKDIGINLKIMADNFTETKFLVTGSASLDLANKINEPLTGRKKTFILYPLSVYELNGYFGTFETKTQLERWLIYGGYPEIVLQTNIEARQNLLAEIIGNYLYRDLLDLGEVKKPGKLVDLLRLLAFQIGAEVAISELASNVAIDRITVEKYLDLLEQSFVIFKVGGFSRNLRKEIAKTSRYYFWDNGIRNALIENFNPLNIRNDKGQLWENFVMVERRKMHQEQKIRTNTYFWRTYDQKEIDLIEESGGHLGGFEIKWSGDMRPATKKEFLGAYPDAKLDCITTENFFLTVK